MGIILLFVLYSPVLPLLYFLIRWFKTDNKIKYSSIMLIISILSFIFGSIAADRSSGLDGLAYIGLILGGAMGVVISLVLFAYSYAKLSVRNNNEDRTVTVAAVFAILLSCVIGYRIYTNYINPGSSYISPIIFALCLLLVFLLSVLFQNTKNKKIVSRVLITLAICISTLFVIPRIVSLLVNRNAWATVAFSAKEAARSRGDEAQIVYMSVGEIIDYMAERNLEPTLIIGTRPTYPVSLVNYVYIKKTDINSGNYDRSAQCASFIIDINNDTYKGISESKYMYSTHLYALNGKYVISFHDGIDNMWLMSESDTVYLFDEYMYNNIQLELVRSVPIKEFWNIYDSYYARYKMFSHSLAGSHVVDRLDANSLRELMEISGVVEKLELQQQEAAQANDEPLILIDEMPESSFKQQLITLRDAGFINGQMVGLKTLDAECSLLDDMSFAPSCNDAQQVEIRLVNEDSSEQYAARSYNGILCLIDLYNKVAYVKEDDIDIISEYLENEYTISSVDHIDVALIDEIRR